MPSNAEMIAQRYLGAADSGTISKDVLFKLPKLVNVTNWKNVVIVGSINYSQKAPPVHYYGILAKYQGGLYYVNQAIVDELSRFDRQFKRIRSTVKVS
jgi:hypothetical protein